jgi:hypothetical protein
MKKILEILVLGLLWSNDNLYKRNFIKTNFFFFKLSLLHNKPRTKISKIFFMRFLGDDVRYIERGGSTSPPFEGINLKSGDFMREDWFPIIFNS